VRLQSSSRSWHARRSYRWAIVVPALFFVGRGTAEAGNPAAALI
jgi:hypothetical protein